MDAFDNFMDILGDLKEQQLNMKELKNEFKLPKKNFPKLSKMIHYFKTEFSTRTRNESRTKWHNYDKQLLFWVVCKYCQINNKFIVASLSKKGQKSMDDNDWNIISSILGVETKILKNKWLVMVKPQVKNAPWTQEEDAILKSLIDSKQSNHNWTQVATQLAEHTQNSSFRNAKQIRERWNNYLNPTLKKSEWEESEDILLLESVLSTGKKWSQISQIMGCRTESQVKNRYNSISNRLKKTYSDAYPEETLVQMEINQLKGFVNTNSNTNSNAVDCSGSSNAQTMNMTAMNNSNNMNQINNINMINNGKKEMQSSQINGNELKTKKSNDLNSSDTLVQVNLRRHKSSADSIITEQHQSPAYSAHSSSSSPQLSEITYPHNDATSLIQLDMNAVAKNELLQHSNPIFSHSSTSSTALTPQNHQQQHHFQIPLPPSFIAHSAYKNQNNNNNAADQMTPTALFSNIHEVSEFNPTNNTVVPSIPTFQETHQPQYITLNYQQYHAVHGQEGPMQNQQQQQPQQQSNCSAQNNQFIPSMNYLYDNLFSVNTPTPANQCNNPSNIYMEDWGFTQMQQTYNAPTPNNNHQQVHNYYSSCNNTTTNQGAPTANGNLDFNSAFHGLEQQQADYLAARRNSSLMMNDSQRHYNYQHSQNHHSHQQSQQQPQQSYHNPNNFFIPTTPSNQTNYNNNNNNIQSFYYEEQY